MRLVLALDSRVFAAAATLYQNQGLAGFVARVNAMRATAGFTV